MVPVWKGSAAVSLSYQRHPSLLLPLATLKLRVPAPQRERVVEVMVGTPGFGFTFTVSVMTLSQPSAFVSVMVFTPAEVMEMPA